MYFSPPAHKCEKPGRFDSSEAKCGRILIRIRKRRLGGLALSAKSKLRKVLLYEPSLLFPLLDFVRPPRNHLEHTSTSVWRLDWMPRQQVRRATNTNIRPHSGLQPLRKYLCSKRHLISRDRELSRWQHRWPYRTTWANLAFAMCAYAVFQHIPCACRLTACNKGKNGGSSNLTYMSSFKVTRDLEAIYHS
jgi:hypothetical protein